MIERYVETQRQRVDGFLSDYLEQRRERATEKLFDAIEYALASGKRLRPILLLASAEAFHLNAEKMLSTAAAIECFHIYSLIHDDLPAMDNSDFRHGRLSTHKKFDEATAILAGDTLIPLGFELLAQETAKHFLAKHTLTLIQTVAHVLGSHGLTGGQLIDLDFLQNSDHTSDDLALMYRRKTGALIELSVSAPAILLGQARKLERLSRFGRALGLAYQLIDDMLDAAEEAHKPTLLRAWGLEKTRTRAHELTDEAIEAIQPLHSERLEELARYLLRRTY